MPSRYALTLARNLKALMAHRAMSQREVAAKSGLGQRTVGEYLRYTDDESRHAGIHAIEALARAFNIKEPYRLLVDDFSAPPAQKPQGVAERAALYDAGDNAGDPTAKALDTGTLQRIIEQAARLPDAFTPHDRAVLITQVYAATAWVRPQPTKAAVFKLLRSI